MSRYATMFARAAAEERCAFGAFVMLGDPDLDASAAILDALARSGADMLEVGIPFSDPVADGPVIQAAADRALRRGVRPGDCLDLLKGFRARHPDVPVGILTYANILFARGKEDFYRRAAKAGVDSVLVADIPAAEAEPFSDAARAEGIAPILIAAPNTPDGTLEKIARLSDGYTYCVARSGVTGAGQSIALNHRALFDRLEALGAPPPVLGFGLSRPDHVTAARSEGAAGVICGSALIARIAESPDDPGAAAAAFARTMTAR
ncbi:tryptophan synthase subunit alpha [Allosphingosinicella flava]|uniref:Tryptophan synthase alpha chain n=1 Tax=Allosphingosinicella flava TaxID=2771430 RepID=A0A7T2GI70_9SPHN|nr:tryptophan synthase subunit alpha [Sphingosinicella flava]QPQ54344.1 tryptophan synthase subunit alpha [Sphingosinicella flava]